MKVALVLALCFVAVSARPQEDIRIIQAENDNSGDGNYKFTYALSDGTNREESGSLKQIGDVQAQTAQGVISWTSPEGQVFTLSYTADERGFLASGDHLPK